tara:strand:+ start:3141 stop:3698 length:558 start_codon:yes stop_codon:yes gene_type:complete
METESETAYTHLLDKKAWGASGWVFLHACAFAYPENDPPAETREAAFWLLRSLDRMLPCAKCRQHYRNATRHVASPAHQVFESRDALARFYVHLHNDVNERLGKPLTHFGDVERLYLDNSKCPSDSTLDRDAVWKFLACLALTLLTAVTCAALSRACRGRTTGGIFSDSARARWRSWPLSKDRMI